MYRKLDNVLKVPSAVTTGGLGETTVTSTTSNDSSAFADMRDYEQAMLVLVVANHNVSGTGANTLTLTPLQATSAAGDGAKAIGSTTAAATGDAATAVVAITADEMDTDGGFRYVGVRVNSNGTDTHRILAVCIRGECKYAASTMPS